MFKVIVNNTDSPTVIQAGQTVNVRVSGAPVPGPGVPRGGTTGQVLKKSSNADFDTEWANEEGGPGGGSTNITYNRRTSNYTLALSDASANVEVEMDVATPNNLTVPQNSSVPIPIGKLIPVRQRGVGQTTIVADPNVVLRSPGNVLSIPKQYALAFLQKVGTNEWYVTFSPALTSEEILIYSLING